MIIVGDFIELTDERQDLENIGILKILKISHGQLKINLKYL